jgi:hypothetical protein
MLACRPYIAPGQQRRQTARLLAQLPDSRGIGRAP